VVKALAKTKGAHFQVKPSQHYQQLSMRPYCRYLPTLLHRCYAMVVSQHQMFIATLKLWQTPTPSIFTVFQHLPPPLPSPLGILVYPIFF
jgi:hypothetical protein